MSNEFQKHQVHLYDENRTKANDSCQEDSCPESHGTEENGDFLVEVRGREERIYYNPQEHNNSRPYDHNPSHDSPANK